LQSTRDRVLEVLSRKGPSTAQEINNYLNEILPYKYRMSVAELSKFIMNNCDGVVVDRKQRGLNVFRLEERSEDEGRYILTGSGIWIMDERIK